MSTTINLAGKRLWRSRDGCGDGRMATCGLAEADSGTDGLNRRPRGLAARPRSETELSTAEAISHRDEQAVVFIPREQISRAS